MSAEGVVSGNPAGVGDSVPEFGGAVGMQGGGGASAARSCAYVVERATGAFGVQRVGVGITWASILSMPYALLASALPKEKSGS